MQGNKASISNGQAGRLERDTASVYSPIVRVYLFLVAIYYLVVTVNHFTSETGQQLLIMAGLSLASVAIAGFVANSLRGENSIPKLEISGLTGNSLMLVNLLYFYGTQYDSERLVYFILMVFIFALTGATRRVSIASCAVAIFSLYAIILIYDPYLLQNYIYIGIASCLAGLGVSLIFRNVISDALNAKLEAAKQRSVAIEVASQATKLSVTDTLTKLPNRRDFFQVLNARAENYLQKGATLTVLMIDLDGFKPVNDTYGHSTGDILLAAVSDRLVANLPRSTYVARVGGDEFAIIASAETTQEVEQLGNNICDLMRTPFDLGQVVVHVGATVGGALRSDASISPTKLIEQADYALFNAKRTKKGTCAVFTKSDANDMKRTFIVDQAMRSANLADELMVAYQPQFDLVKKRVSAFEALARWDSKELGIVNPTEFIHVAEASSLITQVTQILLRQAMVTLREWPSDITLSFNLSAHDILDSVAINEILDIIAQSPDIDPSRVCFEVTETAMMTNIDKAGLALQKLVDAGHAVAVDDFGTGYSNFIYLHKLPISKIKIDKSFVREFSKSTQSTKVLATLLQLTRSLNKECIVEGVETEIELAALQSMGVRTVQGYHCGRPMSAEAAGALIMHQNQNAPQKQQLK